MALSSAFVPQVGGNPRRVELVSVGRFKASRVKNGGCTRSCVFEGGIGTDRCPREQKTHRPHVSRRRQNGRRPPRICGASDNDEKNVGVRGGLNLVVT
jgi:hypothetical protein